MARYLINFTGNLLEWYICSVFFSSLHKQKFSIKIAVPLGAMFTLLQFLNTNFFLMRSSLVAVGSVLYFLLLAALYDSKWYWKVLESLFLYAILATPEICLAMVLQLLLKVDIAYTQSNLVLFAVCTLTTKFLSILIVKILHIRKTLKNTDASGTIVLPMLLLPVATLFVATLTIQAGYRIQNRSFMILSLCSMILLMLANILVLWIIEHQNEFIQTKTALRYAQSHIQNQAAHYQDLYQYQTEIRKFRHDTKNKMLAFNGLLQSGETEKAKALIQTEIQNIDGEANSIIDSGNPVIDAVLQSKLKTTQQKNIILDIRFQLSEKIQINDMELGVLIGNAVDNAIEATEKTLSSNATPKITVEIRSLLQRLWICVKNPTLEKEKSTLNLESTKADRRNHGYGLRSIQSIVDKYDGTLSIHWTDHCFSLEIGLSNL